MYRYYLTLSVIISLLLVSCNRDDNALPSVIADFETEILLGESELGKKLNESVLKLVIDVVGLNPSESLESKAHNDNGPVLEGLKSIGETIKTIKNPT